MKNYENNRIIFIVWYNNNGKKNPIIYIYNKLNY